MILSKFDKLQNYVETCNSAYGNNPLFSHCTSSFTWKYAFKQTAVEVNCKIDDKLKNLFEKNMRGAPASVMGNRYVKQNDTRKK